MAMNFDPMTGEPINPAPTPEQPQMRFDPMTGQPINPTPVQPQMAFDPMTGMPLQQPPKKKKKTGLIAGIVAGVVVIAGAGTVFAGIQSGFFLSKSDKVLRATANTFSEPSHFTEALSGLSVMSSKAYTVDIKGEAEGYSVQATYAEKDNEKQISGSLEGPQFSDVEFLAGDRKSVV